jgi:hypothetical protein
MNGWSTTTTTHRVALAPALAAAGPRLGLAWRDSDRSLRATAIEPGSWPAPATLPERTAHALGLTPSGPDGVMLGWVGNDSRVNLVQLAAGGPGTGLWLPQPKLRLDQARTQRAPALCQHRGSLVLGWTGTDRRVNLLDLARPGQPPIRLDAARRSQAPALASHAGHLILAWTGSDRRVNMLMNALDPAEPPMRFDEARSSWAPALCSHGGALLLAWTGTDRHPNLGLLS